MSEPTNFDPYVLTDDAIQAPPERLWSALRKIGPGIILAGSIIGSGELLLTTSLGAQYGFIFLWLILFSCVIKVFVQIELGRYALSSGKPTLAALNELPGWRFGAHWLVWWWFIMMLATVFQLGAMAGGVGQALHLAFPGVTESLANRLDPPSPLAEEVPEKSDTNAPAMPQMNKPSAATSLAHTLRDHPEHPWAVLTAIVAILLLLSGGYRRIERVTTALVAGVTAVTVVCVAILPKMGFQIGWNDIQTGFSLEVLALPSAAIAAAFGTFGITGVGASELYFYPYWCLEKGYARFTGPRSDDPQWGARARGWMRVLSLDAWVSMVVFTVTTVAFYVMGATVLYRQDLHPDRSQMIATLSQMYVPTFGGWTKIAFLIGVWAVLFKTLYVASASNSRLAADFLSLTRAVHYVESRDRVRWISRFCVFFPTLALVLYLWVGNPRSMVIIGGFFQAATLPIITGAALFLRYRRTDPRLAPSRFSDICLWIAFLSISAVALYAIPTWVMNDLWPLVTGK